VGFELLVQIIQQQIGEQRRPWAAPCLRRGRLLFSAIHDRRSVTLLPSTPDAAWFAFTRL
jgi:hypothetical protein